MGLVKIKNNYFITKINKDFKIYFLFFFSLLLLKIPTSFLPFHLDEMLYVNQTLNILKNNFNPFLPTLAYHPPFLYEQVALLYKIFGFSIFLTHIFIIFWSSILIFTFFKISLFFYNNKKIALLTLFSLVLNPIFFVQSGLFHSEVVVTTLILINFYAYLKEKKLLYLFSGVLAVLTKETAVIFIFFLVVFDSIKKKKLVNSDFRKILKQELFFFLPIISFLIWMLLNKKFLGFFLDPFNMKFLGLEFNWEMKKFYVLTKPFYTENFGTILKNVFLDNGNFIITFIIFIFILFSLINLKNRKNYFREEYVYFLTLIFLFAFIYGKTVYLLRYMLFSYIFLLVIFGEAVKYLTKFNKKIYLIFIFLWLIDIYFIFPKKSLILTNGAEKNLGYVNVIITHIDAIKYLKKNFATAKILTTPTDYLKYKYPHLGYLSTPLEAFDNTDLRFTENNFDIIVVPRYSTSRSIDEFIEKNIEKIRLIRTFNSGSEEIKIYQFKH